MLPKCFVDSCIILEPFGPKVKVRRDVRKGCISFLYSVSNHYLPYISLGVLGEVFNTLVSIEDKVGTACLENRRDKIFSDICAELEKFKMASISVDCFGLAREICQRNYAVTPFDALHIATAITNDCKFLITIDEKLLKDIVLIKLVRSKGLTIRGIKGI